MDPEPPLPETATGSLHIEWRRCGKPNCCCAEGKLHGPYFVRRWRENGKQRKVLVQPVDVLEALAAIEARRRSEAGLSALNDSVDALGRALKNL